MGFKLLRVDEKDSCKIQLEVGKHLIGRGKFLHCDDKRVSRRHGELEVENSSLILKALHTNPCFYVRRNTTTREMLRQNDNIELRHGDKFGLLPVDCWYEVMFAADTAESPSVDYTILKQERLLENETVNNGTEMLDRTEVVNDIGVADSVDSLILAPRSFNENVSDPAPEPDKEPSSPNDSDTSQSLLQDLHLPEASENISDPSGNPEDGNQIPQDPPNPAEQQNSPVKVKTEPVDRDPVHQSPMKRPLTSTSEVKNETGEYEVKKIKMEHDAVTAGTSSGQEAVIRDARYGFRVLSTDSTKTCLTDKSLGKIYAHASQPAMMDRWDHTAGAWANVMRDLPKTQQIFAVKLMSDVLFEAQMNSLCRGSRVEIGLPQDPVAQPRPAGAGAPPPAPATPRQRERCMYGANCYRRNPVHKQEFSHPSDADWGPGARGACPYGAACERRNPAHWTLNTHPPGTLPPAQRQPRGNKQRRKKKRESSESEDSGQDTLNSPDVILTGKRARKKIYVQTWSDSESNDDPFQTDDEDDWRPSGSLYTDLDSQFTQDD